MIYCDLHEGYVEETVCEACRKEKAEELKEIQLTQEETNILGKEWLNNFFNPEKCIFRKQTIEYNKDIFE
jgi:hypothetical protein